MKMAAEHKIEILRRYFRGELSMKSMEVKKKAGESRKRRLEQSGFEPTPSGHPDLQLDALLIAPPKLRDFSC